MFLHQFQLKLWLTAQGDFISLDNYKILAF
jgi:hypothetical protein